MIKIILKTTLIVGTLDIIAACLQAYIKSGVTPDRVLAYIASGVFGKAAFSGGLPMQIMGLLFHFLIALACTACFFWLYLVIPILHKSLLINSLIIALVAWTVTTRFIMPLTPIRQPPFDFVNALQAVAILFFCIGLPIAYFARQYFEVKK